MRYPDGNVYEHKYFHEGDPDNLVYCRECEALYDEGVILEDSQIIAGTDGIPNVRVPVSRQPRANPPSARETRLLLDRLLEPL